MTRTVPRHRRYALGALPATVAEAATAPLLISLENLYQADEMSLRLLASAFRAR